MERTVTMPDFCLLPTKGVFYPVGHPLYKQENVEISDMTTEEEDILVNRNLIKQNIAFDRVLQNVIQTPGVDPAKLTVVDRRALLIQLRINSYGPDYDVSMTCPNCGMVHKRKVNLHDAFHLGLTKVKPLDENLAFFNVSKVADTEFRMELPRSKWNVVFKILSGEDEIRMAKASQNQKKAFKGQDNETQVFSTLLRNLIVSIDDVKDPAVVNQKIRTMPALDAQKLREVYFFVSCNFRLLVDLECNEEGCDYEGEMEIPLTADLFRFNS